MMKAKRFLTLLMSVGMIFAMCVCGSAESGETDAKEAVEAENSGENAATDDEGVRSVAELLNKVYNYQFQPLYDAVAKSVYTNYIEPNGITSEEFKWPDEMSEAWLYLTGLARDYSSSDTDLEDLKTENIEFTLGFLQENKQDDPSTPATEDDLKLMNAVLDGMLVWYEENYDPHERSEFFTVYDELPSLNLIIAGSISFADMEAYQ